MRRREFIKVLAGSVAGTWPLIARAQQGDGVRRVAIFMDLSERDAEGQARVAAFRKGLQDLGWTEGGNVKFDIRWTGGDPGLMRRYAAELVGLAPEVIMNGGLPTLVAMQQETRTIPIVFAQVLDPVGAGFVESLANPGGNITGFVSFEYSMASKWLETLKLVAPHIVRIAAIRDLASPSEMGMLGAIQAVMPAFAMPFIAVGGRDAAEFERGIDGFASEPNGGLIILPSPNTLVHRRVIMAAAARRRLPAIYPYGFFAREGGLLSYGIVPSDNFRRAAGYVDSILKGANPAEMPIQVPTKFELVVNLKTAKELGLSVPTTLLARADEVIE
ncbi:MAG: ABC transporter substrate-binding protein [Pseudolabrys sp.]